MRAGWRRGRVLVRLGAGPCGVLMLVASAACQGDGDADGRNVPSTSGAATTSAPERLQPRDVGDALVFGEDPRSAGEALSAAAVIDNAEQYEGKALVVAGRITEVCEMTGCWFELQSGGKGLTVPIAGERFSLQSKLVGRDAVVAGVVTPHAEEGARMEATAVAVLGAGAAEAGAVEAGEKGRDDG